MLSAMSFSWEAYRSGATDVAPIVAGILPFGLVTGVAAANVGLAPHEAVGLSALVFAGASQLAGLALLGQGAGFVVIVMTTFLINLRMAMYSASLAPWLERLRPGTRLGLSYLITDQAYAFAILRFPHEPHVGRRRDYFLGTATPLLALWLATTWAGARLGVELPPSWQLEFAIPLMFLALLAPAVRDRPGLVAAAVGALLAIALRGLPFNLGLVIAASAGIAAGAVAEATGFGRRADAAASAGVSERAPGRAPDRGEERP